MKKKQKLLKKHWKNTKICDKIHCAKKEWKMLKVVDQRTPIMIQILNSIFERNLLISMEKQSFLNFKRFRKDYFFAVK